MAQPVYLWVTATTGTSPGNLSLLFFIVKAVVMVVFRSQDTTLHFNKLRLMEKSSLKLYSISAVACSEPRLYDTYLLYFDTYKGFGQEV